MQMLIWQEAFRSETLQWISGNRKRVTCSDCESIKCNCTNSHSILRWHCITLELSKTSSHMANIVSRSESGRNLEAKCFSTRGIVSRVLLSLDIMMGIFEISILELDRFWQLLCRPLKSCDLPMWFHLSFNENSLMDILSVSDMDFSQFVTLISNYVMVNSKRRWSAEN